MSELIYQNTQKWGLCITVDIILHFYVPDLSLNNFSVIPKKNPSNVIRDFTRSELTGEIINSQTGSWNRNSHFVFLKGFEVFFFLYSLMVHFKLFLTEKQ